MKKKTKNKLVLKERTSRILHKENKTEKQQQNTHTHKMNLTRGIVQMHVTVQKLDLLSKRVA